MREHQNIFFSGSHFYEAACIDSKSMVGSLHMIWENAEENIMH